WHEREIDIDIILYSNKIIRTEELQIPHPELTKRKFVLIPANEIAGNWKVPTTSKTISELLEDCCDQTTVKICLEE
ncbi:MAG: 2-amino-4-hydroxy-6-hydroxymethyldihydropteridine diphosphokinase, partial [Candidatus Kapaibacteriota bacterium]